MHKVNDDTKTTSSPTPTDIDLEQDTDDNQSDNEIEDSDDNEDMKGIRLYLSSNQYKPNMSKNDHDLFHEIASFLLLITNIFSKKEYIFISYYFTLCQL